MKKKNNKNNKKQQEKVSAVYSKRELINIHAEAYYIALKRMENDKEKVTEECKTKKITLSQKIWMLIKVLFVPMFVKVNSSSRGDMTKNLFAIVSTFVMQVIGYGIWFLGLVSVFVGIQQIFVKGFSGLEILFLIIWAILMLLIGAMFIISAKEIDREQDGERIMMYASNVLTLVSVIIAVIALFGR